MIHAMNSPHKFGKKKKNVCILSGYLKNNTYNQFGFKIISAQVGVFYCLYMIDKNGLQNKELRKIRDKTIALFKWSRS